MPAREGAATLLDQPRTKNVLPRVCVFFTLNRSSTRRHPAHPVSVLNSRTR